VIDHVTIRVPNVDEARRFYLRALELVGFSKPVANAQAAYRLSRPSRQ
jgi:catechol 2,3-dioxygenase-like lactoylglutathione lyase family enzyme